MHKEGGNKEVNGGRTIEINSQFIGHLTDKKDEFVWGKKGQLHLVSSTSAGKEYINVKITKNITKMLRTVTILGSTLPLRGLVNVIFGTVLMVSLSGMSSDRDAKN